MSTLVVRQRSWRPALLAWAIEVRGQPYIWGETDCGALVCKALRLQFGVDLFASLPPWSSARSALRAWGALLKEAGGYATLLSRMGATEVRGRVRGRWPMGTILISREDAGPLPALGIYVDPIVVQSDQECGVQWSDPSTADIESAWLFERVVLNHG